MPGPFQKAAWIPFESRSNPSEHCLCLNGWFKNESNVSYLIQWGINQPQLPDVVPCGALCRAREHCNKVCAGLQTPVEYLGLHTPGTTWAQEVLHTFHSEGMKCATWHWNPNNKHQNAPCKVFGRIQQINTWVKKESKAL